MALLELNHVSYVAGGKQIIRDISFSVDSGEFISVVGPSGSGKSTVLKLCSDLISATSGTILLDGRNIDSLDPTDYRKNVGYIFQRPYLFAKTVRRNIYFPFDIRGIAPDEERIAHLFELLHMPISYMDRKNDELSGGEMQRICMIRSLLFEPRILLLDEVTSALDAENTAVVERVIEGLHHRGVTILSVTHNEAQSRRLANRRMIVVDGGIAGWEVF